MQARRQQLGGYMPQRKACATPLKALPEAHFEEFYKGTEGREASTTMVFVRLLAKLLRDPDLGKLIVPSFPDEARPGAGSTYRQIRHLLERGTALRTGRYGHSLTLLQGSEERTDS